MENDPRDPFASSGQFNPLNDPRDPFVPSSPFKPLKDGWGIQPIGPTPDGGGDLHDTLHIDKDGNLDGGHTTIQLPDGPKKRLLW